MENNIERIAMSTAMRALQIVNDQKKIAFTAKIQVSKQDIIETFDKATYEFLTKRLSLTPVRQNGKNGRLYYNTRRVLELVEKWYHI